MAGTARPQVAEQLSRASALLKSGKVSIEGAAQAAQVMLSPQLYPDEVKLRDELVVKLGLIPAVWFMAGSVYLAFNRLGCKAEPHRTGGARIRLAAGVFVRNAGVYPFVVDIDLDVNGGLAVSQWRARAAMRNPESIKAVLTPGTSTLKQSELEGKYFEQYSGISEITEQKRRSLISLADAVTRRLTEVVSGMQSG